MRSAGVATSTVDLAVPAGDLGSTPFSSVRADISKEDLIRLRADLHFWQAQHGRSVQREADLKQEIETLRARIRYLEQQLFGRKSERSGKADRRRSDQTGSPEQTRPRGQQPGAPGHGRTRQDHLPAEDEVAELAEADQRCPCCGAPLLAFPGSEDSEVLEIEVRAYRRRIHRKRYRPGCRCGAVAGIVTAPAPNRLIAKGKYGISLWVTILLDKFLYLRPTHRLLHDLRGHGLALAPGTVTGGLRALAPLFEPLVAAIHDKQRSDDRWHADETGWRVFEEVAGKLGHRWYLWLFQSPTTVLFRLDPWRSAALPKAHFETVGGGIIVCDRYAAYKKMVREVAGAFLLAYCWAHVRRDFLSLAETHEDWGLAWVERIGTLYRLNGERLAVRHQARRFAVADKALRASVAAMLADSETELRDPSLHPARAKRLKSLQAHWAGLTVFVDHPDVPMDNNSVERLMRNPVLGRKNFYGSRSIWSGHLAADLFSILHTLELWQINPRRWLTGYLQACAEAGNQPPQELTAFLPWSMDEIRRQAASASP